MRVQLSQVMLGTNGKVLESKDATKMGVGILKELLNENNSNSKNSCSRVGVKI